MVAPDESFVILPVYGLPDSLGGWDYYIVFRREDDSWSEPINLGAPVNSRWDGENSTSLSQDGKYLFFASARVPSYDNRSERYGTFYEIQTLAREPGKNGDVSLYWVDATFLRDLRKRANFRQPLR